MKRVIGLFILTFLLTAITSAVHSQQNWTATNGFPDLQVLKTLCIAKDFGWGNITVGGEVTQRNVFTSTDDGTSWTNLGPHPSGVIYAIAQEQSTLGTKYCAIRDWQNSNNNGIYRRHNTYGWQLKACQGLDVRCVIQRYGTVLAGCRESGRGIYRSTNDGDTWSQIYNNADIYCFDAKNNTMYAGGAYTSGAGILLKSTAYPFDTWLEVGYFDGYVIGLWVTESGNIWVATHKNKIYRSINGESFEVVKNDVNWDELKIPITSNSSNQVFVGDYQTGVWYTTDDGTNWLQYNTGLSNLHITDLAIKPTDQKTLYATLGDGLSSHIYKLATPISPPPPPPPPPVYEGWIAQNCGTTEDLNSVYFINSNTGWTVGSAGTILKTINGGTNWISQTSGTSHCLQSVFFIDANIGWTVGQFMILKTTNGGTNWVAQNSGLPTGTNWLNSVFFTDANVGYVVGEHGSQGVILKTIDGGDNWFQLNIGETHTLQSVHFPNDNIGYVVGYDVDVNNGTILKTTEAGANWAIQYSGKKVLRSVYFTDVNTGWTVGDGEKILKTTDGGSNWIIQNRETQKQIFFEVFFIDINNGWIAGTEGTILNTSDGGLNWITQTSGTTNWLSSVYFTDLNNGWTVGNEGIILHTTNGGLPVELVSFNGIFYQKTNSISLEWQTATETNNYGFEVERAISGDWEKIGFVNGNGTTTIPKKYTFTDSLNSLIEQLPDNSNALKYRLKQIDFNGIFEYSPEVEVTIGQKPLTFSLSQNYPNPFNPTTTINFSLPKSSQVTLKVFDILGREVITILNEKREAGMHSIKFDSNNLPGGLYFYKLETGDFIEIKKMMILK